MVTVPASWKQIKQYQQGPWTSHDSLEDLLPIFQLLNAVFEELPLSLQRRRLRGNLLNIGV